MDKRKYIALSLEEERRSTRPRLNNHNSNASTAPSKPKPNNSSNNNPASQPVNNNSPDQNVKEDPFKQVQGDELEDGDDDDDDDDGVKRPVNAKRAGRRKIKIEYIQEKSRRHITFSKRKSGIMKKAFELSTLTGTQVLLLVVSETGLVYTFTTPKLQPIVTKDAGRNLIQACLHSADPATADGAGAKSDEDDNDEVE
ncbi:SRF-TF-domain-containing protein [Linnemannia elongata AG-77]|uniref:SRF-TF-domain-containing protein n=1 Tax=Linnemannia elongata AG-77 TaxID=1314771 RepID=A0A197JGQ9_9FUNG|nr:SRF-TF-domain-containing protein [Linnemannia elongata AG-77]